MSRTNPARLTSGFKELDAKLRDLGKGMANTIVRKGQRTQCRVYVKAMRSAAPDKVTKKSIGYKVGMVRGQNVAKVGMDVGKKRTGKGGYDLLKRAYGHAGLKIPAGIINPIAHLLVLGTKARFRGKKSMLSRIVRKVTGSRFGFTGQMKTQSSFVKQATQLAEVSANTAMEEVITAEVNKIWNSK